MNIWLRSVICRLLQFLLCNNEFYSAGANYGMGLKVLNIYFYSGFDMIFIVAKKMRKMCNIDKHTPKNLKPNR